MDSDTISKLPNSKLALPRKSLVLLGTLALMAVFLAVLSVGGASAAGPTYIDDTSITSDTTWNLTDSPYILNNTVTVQNGATLTIQPGVEIYTNYSLVVNGGLVASGNANAMIEFHSNDPAAFWGGLTLNANNTGTVLTYVLFDNATTAVDVHNRNLTVTNCLFTNGGTGISARYLDFDGTLTVQNNEFDIGSTAVAVDYDYTAYSAVTTVGDFLVTDNVINVANAGNGISLAFDVYAYSAGENSTSSILFGGDVLVQNNDVTTHLSTGINVYYYAYALNSDVNATVSASFSDVQVLDNSVVMMEPGFATYGILVAPYAYSYSTMYLGSATVTVGDVIVDGNSVSIASEALSASKSIDAVYINPYYANAYATYGSASTTMGDFILQNNVVDVLLTNVTGVGFAFINGATIDFTYGPNAMAFNNASADLTIGAVTIANNEMTVYANYSHQIEVNAFELDMNYLTAMAYGDGTEAITVIGDISIVDNTVDVTMDHIGHAYINTVGAYLYGEESNWYNNYHFAYAYYGQAGFTMGLLSVSDNSVAVDLSYVSSDSWVDGAEAYVEYANAYASYGSATAALGDIMVENNDLAVTYDDVASSSVYGPYLYMGEFDNTYAEAYYGEAAITVGDISVSDNNVDVTATDMNSLGVYGVYVGFDGHAGAQWGNSTATYGSFAVDGNVVTVITDYVEDLTYDGVEMEISQLYVIGLFSNVTLAAGDFTLCDNIVILDAEYGSDVSVTGVSFSTVRMDASLMGNGSVSAEFGDLVVEDNLVDAEAYYMFEYYPWESTFYFEGVIVQVDESNVLLDGTIYPADEEVSLVSGDVSVSGNIIGAATNFTDDVVFTGVSVDYGSMSVDASEGTAVHVVGEFEVCANLVDFSVEYAEMFLVDGIYATVDSMYASSENGTAGMTIGNILMIENDIEIVAEHVEMNEIGATAEDYGDFGLYFELTNAYAMSEDDGLAEVDIPSITISDNYVSYDMTDVGMVPVDAALIGPASTFTGVGVSLDSMYAATLYGEAEVTVGDVAVCSNDVSFSVYASDDLVYTVNGIALEVRHLYAAAVHGDATATYGNFAVDGNDFELVAEEVDGLSVNGIRVSVYDMGSDVNVDDDGEPIYYSMYGNATLTVGDFAVCGNDLTFDAAAVNHASFEGIYFATISEEWYCAWAINDATAISTIGDVVIEGNEISASATDPEGYWYEPTFYFEAIHADVMNREAYADGTGAEAYATSGQLRVCNNMIDASSGMMYFVEYDGIIVHGDEMYAYADDESAATSVVGEVNVSANTINYAADGVYDLDVAAIYASMEDMYAQTEDDSEASVTTGDIIMSANIVSILATHVGDVFQETGMFEPPALLSLFIGDCSARNMGDGSAVATYCCIVVEHNEISIEATDGSDVNLVGIAVMGFGMSSFAVGGEAQVEWTATSVSYNEIDAVFSERQDVVFDGIFVNFVNMACTAIDADATATYGDIAVDCNVFSINAEYVETINANGIDVYVFNAYAFANGGNATLMFGDVTVCENELTFSVEYTYSVETDGINVSIYGQYAMLFGNGLASATYGDVAVDGNAVTSYVHTMDYYGGMYDLSFTGISVTIRESFAVVNGGAAENLEQATLVRGDLSVANNELGLTSYEVDEIYFNGIDAEFDGRWFVPIGGASAMFGNASMTVGSLAVSDNTFDIYADHGDVYVSGIYFWVDDIYADADTGNATACVGDVLMVNNKMTIETINVYFIGAEFGYGAIFSLEVEDFYAEAFEACATFVGGDIKVCNNEFVATQLSGYSDYEDEEDESETDYEFDVIYVSISNVYADADMDGVANAVMGDIIISENSVDIGEAYMVYGLDLWLENFYADASYGDASVTVGSLNITSNEFVFAEAYECIGIMVQVGDIEYYESDEIYVASEYGGSAELVFEYGANIVGNTVTMSQAMDCTAIYVEPIYAYVDAMFEDSTAALDLNFVVSGNTVVLEGYEMDEVALVPDNYYLDGIRVDYYVFVYYDEAEAYAYGMLTVDSNSVTLTNANYGEGMCIWAAGVINEESNNGEGSAEMALVITDNDVCGGYTGIDAGGYNPWDMVQLTITGNEVCDAYYAISLSFIRDLVYDDNVVTNAGVELEIYYGLNITIVGQDFSDNLNDGVIIEYVENLVFSGNTVCNNEDVGLQIRDGINVTVANNLVGGNGYGVDLSEVENTLVNGNTVSYNLYGAMSVEAGDNVTLTNNVVTYNGGGVNVDDVYRLIVEDNIFSMNEYTGLKVEDCGFYEEEDGPSIFGYVFGIYEHGFVIIGNNTFKNNVVNGLYVVESEYVTIYNGVYTDNGVYGIYVQDGYRNEWIIDTAAEVRDNDASFEGKITVCPGATLTLESVSEFDLAGDNEYSADASKIEVMEGGCLKATLVGFTSNMAAWYFVVNGNLTMIDCSLMFVATLYLGPTSHASIDTTSFMMAMGSGITVDNSAPRISGCTIQSSSQDGIVIMGADAKPVIKGCLIWNNERGIYARDTCLQYVVDNVILNNDVAGIYAQNVTGAIHDNVLFLNYREIFVQDSDVSVEDNQIGYAKVLNGYGPYASVIMQVVMDLIKVNINLDMFSSSGVSTSTPFGSPSYLMDMLVAASMNTNIGIYAVDSTVAAKGNDYGWLQYGVYAIGSDLTFSDKIETNYFQISWYGANGTKYTFDLPFTVYDGIFATESMIEVSGASIECVDDALFLEASHAQVSDTTFLAGDFDVYLMEGSTCAINTSKLDNYKVDDTSVWYQEYCLTVTVKDQDGSVISGAAVVVVDANGKVWSSGTTNSKGVFLAYLPAFGELSDGSQDKTVNPYTVSASKDNVTKNATVTMGEADQSVGLTLQVKKNSIFGMEPWVIGVIALVVVVALLAVLMLARRK